MLFSNDPAIWLKDFLIESGLSYSLASLLSTIGLVLIVVILSWLSNMLAKAVILNIVTRIVKRTSSQWDDIFLEQKVFTRLSHLAPALVIWFMAGWALKTYPIWLVIVHKFTYIYMVVVCMVVVNSFVEAWHHIYLTLPISQHRHIKGYVQLVKIFVVLVALLIVISVVFKKEVSTLLTGLGVMASVLILVFKDTLLGLVASIQLSANKMLNVGDWISIPNREVDGVVRDITLNTVMVQNFDKTIITMPTYSLVNDSFQNWRGMEQAGVRQIKRSIYIDMKSIRFPDDKLKMNLRTLPMLKEFAGSFEEEYNNYGSGPISNLGIFRYYTESYLKQHPVIDKEQIIMVRHRNPEGNGLPLQVIAFTNKTDTITYENVQSEIFEHILSVMNEFGLKVYQQPSGEDILALSKNGIVKTN